MLLLCRINYKCFNMTLNNFKLQSIKIVNIMLYCLEITRLDESNKTRIEHSPQKNVISVL